MKILAIVSEYNPFHLGHAYHLKQSKEILAPDGVMAVMSGSIMQRGEFALLNKWERTRLALKSGVDLVCELPFVYAAQSAETFASGAIDLVNRSGICSYLSFGSEHGEITQLNHLASYLADENPSFKDTLKKNLTLGHSFAKSRELVIQSLLGEEYAKLLKQPNNILAIEYLKALHRQKSNIRPITISRVGAGYHSLENSSHLSANFIRKQLIDNNRLRKTDHKDGWDSKIEKILSQKLPYPTTDLLKAMENYNLLGNQNYLNALRFCILGQSISQIRKLAYVSEGLEHKIRDASKTASSLTALIDGIVSKRIPRTRVQRILANCIVSMKALDLSQAPYLRILGFNQKGQVMIKAIKDEGGIYLINNARKSREHLSRHQNKMLNYDIRATDLHNLFYEKDYFYHRDLCQDPIRI